MAPSSLRPPQSCQLSWLLLLHIYIKGLVPRGAAVVKSFTELSAVLAFFSCSIFTLKGQSLRTSLLLHPPQSCQPFLAFFSCIFIISQSLKGATVIMHGAKSSVVFNYYKCESPSLCLLVTTYQPCLFIIAFFSCIGSRQNGHLRCSPAEKLNGNHLLLFWDTLILRMTSCRDWKLSSFSGISTTLARTPPYSSGNRF